MPPSEDLPEAEEESAAEESALEEASAPAGELAEEEV
jgi:hypothetical protein